MNTNTNTAAHQGAHHNPLDRNHDGKVNLKDLSSKGHNNIVAPGTSTTTTTTTSTGFNPLDRNHDGRVDAKDFVGGQQQVYGQQGVHHNPLDRNHDGRVDARDFQNQNIAGQTTTTYVQSNQRASIGLTRAEPTKIELIEKDVVIHEHIHPVQKEEIQPIIYREREQLDVKQVTQMMHETQIQPTIIQQRELPAERREAVIERGAAIQENYVAPSREVDATLRTQVVHAPIVNEVIKKTIIEEIQPVLERDIITSTVIQNTQPIYEKVVEAPHVYRETVTVVDRGIVGGDLAALQAQGFNLGETGRRLSQTYTTSPVYSQGGLTQQGVHHNPLDRNHDGRVDAKDFVGGQQTYGQNYVAGQGMNQGVHHNPLDRNHDGRVDARDFVQGSNQGHVGNEAVLTKRGLQNDLTANQGLAQGAHHNPLDRNHDGKVNLKDLSGKPAATGAHQPVNTL